MRATRIIALVIGSLLGLVASALLVSGTVLAGTYAARSDDGFVDVGLEPLVTSNVAVTAEEIDLETEPGTPDWIIEALDTDVRLRVTSIDGDRPVFVGVATEADLDDYLAGVAHDEIRDVDEDLTAEYRTRSGSDQVGPPTDEDFWAVSVWGEGTQELTWEAASGRWAVAVMNADGSPGVAADVEVGIRSAALLPVALGLLVTGLFTITGAVMLIVAGYPPWVYRVVAHASLTTDRYPPFRLDLGGAEPGPLPAPPRPSAPDDTAVEIPAPSGEPADPPGGNGVIGEPAAAGSGPAS